jgi:hypothetical protein
MSFSTVYSRAVNSNIPSIPIINLSSTYSVNISDGGKILNCTGNSFTLSLPPAITIRLGFYITLWNSSSNSTDVVTVDPNGLETIDGVDSLTLHRGEGLQILCDGTNWQVNSDRSTRLYAENSTPTSVRPYAVGSNSVALGTNSSSSITGKYAYASGQFTAAGDAQFGMMVLRAQTSDDTITVLTSDAEAASLNNQVILPNDSTYFFRVNIVARRSDINNESAAYIFEGCIDRNSTPASTSFIGAPSKQLLAEDTMVWDANLVADTVYGGLSISVVGEAGKSIKWVATVQTVEVTG